jgi:hypothetical protein
MILVLGRCPGGKILKGQGIVPREYIPYSLI